MYTKYFFKIGDRDYVVDKLRQFLYSRWYLKTPANKMSSIVYDSSMAQMVADYQSYHKISSQQSFFNSLSNFSPTSAGVGSYFNSLNNFSMQTGGLNEATYEQIGKELTSEEIDSWALHDVDVKRLLYGVAGIDLCATWDTIAPVIPKNKFIGWGYEGVSENCFSYCVKQLSVVGKSMKSPNWGSSTAISPHIYQLYLTQDVAGMKKGYQVKAFTDGVIYLKSALKAGTAVVVGVEDGAGSPNKDKVTDHFVTIVGMGSDATGKYFSFYDNATGNTDSGTSDQNKLYCNCDKFEIKGTGPNGYIQGTEFQYYIVTQIRETK